MDGLVRVGVDVCREARQQPTVGEGRWHAQIKLLGVKLMFRDPLPRFRQLGHDRPDAVQVELAGAGEVQTVLPTGEKRDADGILQGLQLLAHGAGRQEQFLGRMGAV